MPYVKPSQREQYQDLIRQTVRTLLSDKNNNLRELDVGELNYFISSIIWKLFDLNPRYKTANDLMGVLECVKQEFVRRRVNSYEDSKILENGDI